MKDYREIGDLIRLRGLFCLFFVGGQEISCFKLNRLQTDWNTQIWVCLGLAVFTFWIVFEVLCRIYDGWSAADMRSVYCFYASTESPLQAKRLLHSMTALVVISYPAFLFEVWKLGLVSLFSYGIPHAYFYFHISGAHYFTVSHALVPSLLVMYSLMISRRGRGLTRGQGLWLGILMVAPLPAVPVLCVSRFQLTLAVDMAVFISISISGTFNLICVGVLMVCTIPAYLILTAMRSCNVECLGGTFEMRNSHMSVFITQPYMYIVDNYGSSNCLVEQLASHSPGPYMCFPVWVLTGLKFPFPALASFPLFMTKKESTTLTLLYDAYYDFGIFGMMLLGRLLGATCYFLVKRRREISCSAGHVIYAQVAMCMVLSLFITWFSNPATWFYLVVTGIVYVYIES